MTDTPEGYLICHDVPINRTGEQIYLARELQLDGDPERCVTVHRYPEDVFDPAALASFEGKDVTAGHPPEGVVPENHAMYSRGHVQNVRRAGEQTLADLHIKDPNLISDIKNGVIREVSCGYQCRYELDGTGYRQTHIRGNHVAVVLRGRAGHDIAIKDAAAAEKGNHFMNEFWKSILTAFGMAAKEATPEELETMVTTTAGVLDAAPSEEQKEEKPKTPSLEEKLNKALDRLDALEKTWKESAGSDGRVETIPADDQGSPPSSQDEAMKNLRSAVESIPDETVRAKVSDALLSTLDGKETMQEILKAATDSAKATAEENRKTTYEKLCADSAAAYAARNPHKKKEE